MASSKGTAYDLTFVFRGVKVSCSLDPGKFPPDAMKRVQASLAVVTAEIRIDRTYVDYPGTKYTKTFLVNEGWEALCRLVAETGYGRRASRVQEAVMMEAYRKMIACYCAQVMSDAGYDVSGMVFSVPETSRFEVEYLDSSGRKWEFPGRWQTWGKAPM